ncbi:DUF6788 family protein [Alicyclobacillus acidocaldarius]|uniref:DUF6788 family protein n=1 Tax=Alicyclobacillus acidocaldarius TaxID=405212 RepID=UPI0035BE33B6
MIPLSKRSILVLHRNRQQQHLLAHLDGAIAGSLVETYRTCGKPNCICHSGQKHGPYYLLTWSENGRTRTCHVPAEKVDAVRTGVERFRAAREALQKLGEYNRRLMLEDCGVKSSLWTPQNRECCSMCTDRRRYWRSGLDMEPLRA